MSSRIIINNESSLNLPTLLKTIALRNSPPEPGMLYGAEYMDGSKVSYTVRKGKSSLIFDVWEDQ